MKPVVNSAGPSSKGAGPSKVADVIDSDDSAAESDAGSGEGSQETVQSKKRRSVKRAGSQAGSTRAKSLKISSDNDSSSGDNSSSDEDDASEYTEEKSEEQAFNILKVISYKILFCFFSALIIKCFFYRKMDSSRKLRA